MGQYRYDSGNQGYIQWIQDCFWSTLYGQKPNAISTGYFNTGQYRYDSGNQGYEMWIESMNRNIHWIQSWFWSALYDSWILDWFRSALYVQKPGAIPYRPTESFNMGQHPGHHLYDLQNQGYEMWIVNMNRSIQDWLWSARNGHQARVILLYIKAFSVFGMITASVYFYFYLVSILSTICINKIEHMAESSKLMADSSSKVLIIFLELSIAATIGFPSAVGFWIQFWTCTVFSLAFYYWTGNVIDTTMIETTSVMMPNSHHRSIREMEATVTDAGHQLEKIKVSPRRLDHDSMSSCDSHLSGVLLSQRIDYRNDNRTFHRK